MKKKQQVIIDIREKITVNSNKKEKVSTRVPMSLMRDSKQEISKSKSSMPVFIRRYIAAICFEVVVD